MVTTRTGSLRLVDGHLMNTKESTPFLEIVVQTYDRGQDLPILNVHRLHLSCTEASRLASFCFEPDDGSPVMEPVSGVGIIPNPSPPRSHPTLVAAGLFA